MCYVYTKFVQRADWGGSSRVLCEDYMQRLSCGTKCESNTNKKLQDVTREEIGLEHTTALSLHHCHVTFFSCHMGLMQNLSLSVEPTFSCSETIGNVKLELKFSVKFFVKLIETNRQQLRHTPKIPMGHAQWSSQSSYLR